MFRLTVLAALAFVALAPERAAAQPGTFRVVDAQAVKGKLQWIGTKSKPVTKEITVEVEENGKKIVKKEVITVLETITETEAADLKVVKVTDATGKEVAANKLAGLFKQATPVVIVSGPVSDKHRALFKDTTLFVELPELVPFPPQPVPVVDPVPKKP